MNGNDIYLAASAVLNIAFFVGCFFWVKNKFTEIKSAVDLTALQTHQHITTLVDDIKVDLQQGFSGLSPDLKKHVSDEVGKVEANMSEALKKISNKPNKPAGLGSAIDDAIRSMME